VPRGQRVLYSRAWLSRDHGEAPSPVQAASWLDIKRIYMEMRPTLRRIYSIVQDVATYGPMVAPLGFELLPGNPIEFDGVPYYATQNDFGPSSIDGWLSRLVAAELQIEDEAILDLVQHQLVLDGRRVDLTRLEFDVISYLQQRQGHVVERAALLQDVWGYEYTGGSNVIEANVRSLRRKLGDRAGWIVTVRGLGYRFSAPGRSEADTRI
jgi:DNA-binding winged helix-turn-helix (wHTH) protein